MLYIFMLSKCVLYWSSKLNMDIFRILFIEMYRVLIIVDVIV